MQTHDQVRVEEPAGQRLDVSQVETAGAPGRHRLDHLGFPETRVLGAEAGLGVDEPGEQLPHRPPVDLPSRSAVGSGGSEQRRPGGQSDRRGFAVPAAPEAFGSEGAVLGRPGRHAGRLVRPHPLPPPGRAGADVREVRLDLDRPLREGPQLRFADAGHLAAAVAIRAPS